MIPCDLYLIITNIFRVYRYLVIVLDNRDLIPGGGRYLFLFRVQTGSGTHSTSYSLGAEGSSPGGKASES